MSNDTSVKGHDNSDAPVKESGAPLGLESMQAGSDIPILGVENATAASTLAEEAAHRRRANRRVAWTLGLLCSVFFGGIIAARMSGDSRVGLITLGIAISLFLVVAIGRNLRK
ncbi:MAG: hypothetical protein U1F58_07730 [Burkholderiales bacterium]